MAIVFKTQDIVRKHDLIRKESKEGLTTAEQKELNEIEKHLKKIRDELLDLNRKGVKFENGVTTKQEEEMPEKMEKPKMTPFERKIKTENMITKGREEGLEKKRIIKQIMAELVVSNTYVNKIYNAMKAEKIKKKK